MFLNRILLLLLRIYIWNTFSLTIHNIKWFFYHLHQVTNCNASIFLSFLNERESNTFYYMIILNLVEKLWDVLNGNFKQIFFFTIPSIWNLHFSVLRIECCFTVIWMLNHSCCLYAAALCTLYLGALWIYFSIAVWDFLPQLTEWLSKRRDHGISWEV